jgi:cysteine desulfuration protein SufE
MGLLENEKNIKKIFENTPADQFYDKLIQLGKELPPYPTEFRLDENRVVGCQSLMFCHISLANEKITILIESEALISKGIAALVVALFSGLTAKEVFEKKVEVFESIGLVTSLSLTRLNGLQSLLNYFYKKTLNLLNSN